jgi:hypothetical protein
MYWAYRSLVGAGYVAMSTLTAALFRVLTVLQFSVDMIPQSHTPKTPKPPCNADQRNPMDKPPPIDHYIAKYNGDRIRALQAAQRDLQRYMDFQDPEMPDPDDPDFKTLTRGQARIMWKALHPEARATPRIRARSPRKSAVDPPVNTEHTQEKEARNDGDAGQGT